MSTDSKKDPTLDLDFLICLHDPKQKELFSTNRQFNDRLRLANTVFFILTLLATSLAIIWLWIQWTQSAVPMSSLFKSPSSTFIVDAVMYFSAARMLMFSWRRFKQKEIEQRNAEKESRNPLEWKWPDRFLLSLLGIELLFIIWYFMREPISGIAIFIIIMLLSFEASVGDIVAWMTFKGISRKSGLTDLARRQWVRKKMEARDPQTELYQELKELEKVHLEQQALEEASKAAMTAAVTASTLEQDQPDQEDGSAGTSQKSSNTKRL